MRCAILGDIHGNFHAFEAVLEDIKSQGVEAILCIGDIVGYAASPKECIQAVQEHCTRSVAGNHDYGAVDKINLAYFNADARDALEWTKEQLSKESLDYLAGLPFAAEFDEFFLVHSTPYYPEYFFYIQTLYDAGLAFKSLERRLAFVGHSHVPIVFINTDPVDYFQVDEFDLPADQKVILNVGSVGQPRDLDPRACYAVVDTKSSKVSLRRIEYDIGAAAEAILKAGLPRTNAQRLFLGR